jgi:MFS family permease
MSESVSPNEKPSSIAPSTGAAPRFPLVVIFLTLFLDLAGFSIIFPLSPDLLDHYLAIEGSESGLGKLISLIQSASLAPQDRVYTAALFGGVLAALYSILQFLFSPIWGSLSDRTGRKPILIISNCGIALSYLLWALSGNFTLFVVSRLLAGAMGGNISVATAAAADASSRENRAKAMGIVGAAFGLGFICGPAIGGGLSGLDLAARFPSLVPYGVNRFSAAALGAFALALTSVFWVTFRFQETLRPEARGERGERRTINPVRFFRRFDFPGVREVNIITFLYLLAFSGMEFTLTFLAKKVFHYQARDNTWLFVFVGAIMVLVQGGLVRRVVPRFGERLVSVAGLAMVVPGFVIMGCAESYEHHPAFLYLGLFFMAVGSGLVTPATTSLVSLYTPADRQGGVLGVFRSLGSFSRAVGPLVATPLFWKFGPQVSYLLGGLILLPPMVMAFLLPPPPKND